LQTKASVGEFRSDLFHRINVVAVTLPSLRERGEDIVLLAEAFVRSICREYGITDRRLSPDAKAWMLNYGWPGNVRELRNQIERIVLLENDDVIRAEHFRASQSDARRVAVSQSNGALRISLPPSGVPLELIEREVIREALERCDGNVSRAARYLSITRQTLIYRMKKHGLDGNGRTHVGQRN
jgi:DNA-binding NtrC family response regulator